MSNPAERREPDTSEVELHGGGRSRVARRDDVVLRDVRPWTPSVHALLRHLEEAGFAGSPRLVGDGFDGRGCEALYYIEGETVAKAWSDASIHAVGRMLRRLHDATATFDPGPDAAWRPWFGRSLGGSARVVGHGDPAPWNIVARDGCPVALIDWEVAGPVDRDVELAQACWLNARLFDDDVARKEGLESPERRARQARLLLDGYGLSGADRSGFVELMIEFAIQDAAQQAIDGSVTAETLDASSLWAITWRTRSAAWMARHRAVLEAAIEG